MALTKVCEANDLPKGQMAAFFVEGWEVLVIRDDRGDLHAMDGICPHEEYPLIYGELDDDVLVCAGHAWCFDVTTGDGLTQPGCRLTKYHVVVRGTEIYVDREREATTS